MEKAKRNRLEKLIEEATIDCYDEEEQHSGLLTMIGDNVECPFNAKIVGEEIRVVEFEWPKKGFGLYAICEREGKRHRVDVNSIEWIQPHPEGFEWIEAYLYWREGL